MKPIDKNCMNCKYACHKEYSELLGIDTSSGHCCRGQLMMGHFDEPIEVMPYVTVFHCCEYWEPADD